MNRNSIRIENDGDEEPLNSATSAAHPVMQSLPSISHLAPAQPQEGLVGASINIMGQNLYLNELVSGQAYRYQNGTASQGFADHPITHFKYTKSAISTTLQSRDSPQPHVQVHPKLDQNMSASNSAVATTVHSINASDNN